MKKIILLLLLFSCALPLSNDYEFPKVYCLEDLNFLIKHKIEYVRGYKGDIIEYFDNRQTPYTTWETKKGNCADKALLFIDQANKQFGYEGNFLCIDGPNGYHAIVRINNKFYDPTNATVYKDSDMKYDIMYEIEYYWIMDIAKYLKK